jgi:hypothetical protein
MRHSRIASLLVVGSVVLGACSDQVTSPPELSPDGGARLSQAAGSGLPTLKLNTAVLDGRVTDMRVPLGPGRAINPGEYVCQGSTPITEWFDDRLQEVIDDDVLALIDLLNLAADQIPTYEAFLFEEPTKKQEFGYDGEFTNVMNRTVRDVKRFWDIDSDAIQVVPMHGTVLLDVEKVAATYEALFVNDDGSPISHEDAILYATIVRDAVAGTESLNGGNHPLFTFNSVSFRSNPGKIVMGDGILEGYAAVGFGDVAPQAVFAHEFAHQIQFQNNYSVFSDGIPVTTQAEVTRYTELMADAYSAYYLTHKRGAAMNKHRVAEFLETFFQIGDCYFSDPGHHGTPNQRMAAAQFGFDVADQAQKQGHILTADQFHALFVAKYPQLIAPDAPGALVATAAH